MKRLLLLAFILFGSVAFGASISDGSRDHGAARSDLSNVDPTSSLAINSLEVSGIFRANPSVLENQYRFTMAMSWVRGDYPSDGVATYTDGPAHGKGTNAFYGSTLMPNGKVMLTPLSSANIGIYDPKLNVSAVRGLANYLRLPFFNKF